MCAENSMFLQTKHILRDDGSTKHANDTCFLTFVQPFTVSGSGEYLLTRHHHSGDDDEEGEFVFLKMKCF